MLLDIDNIVNEFSTPVIVSAGITLKKRNKPAPLATSAIVKNY